MALTERYSLCSETFVFRLFSLISWCVWQGLASGHPREFLTWAPIIRQTWCQRLVGCLSRHERASSVYLIYIYLQVCLYLSSSLLLLYTWWLRKAHSHSLSPLRSLPCLAETRPRSRSSPRYPSELMNLSHLEIMILWQFLAVFMTHRQNAVLILACFWTSMRRGTKQDKRAAMRHLWVVRQVSLPSTMMTIHALFVSQLLAICRVFNNFHHSVNCVALNY